MMTGKQKLYFLLDAIESAQILAPSGQPLKIHATHDLNKKFRGIELDQLFTKLEKDEKVIKIIKAGNRIKEAGSKYGLNEPDDGCWHIKLLPSFSDYFTKIQEEPEYQEFTGKTPPTQNKIKTNKKALDKTGIDKWLTTKDQWTLKKIWQVISALNSEWQLRDENNFDIPHDKFNRARIKSPKDLEAILKTLHKHAIIKVSKKISETPPSKDPSIPQGSLWVTIIDEPKITQDSSTQIRIFPKQFTYLRNRLIKMVSKQAQEKKGQGKKQSKGKTDWPEEFRWEGEKFIFGKYGSIDFTSKDRRFILKTLTNKKGDWTTINAMKGPKDAGYVRSTIKQIEDRLPKKAKGHIVIVSTKDDDLEEKPDVGAYRIKILP